MALGDVPISTLEWKISEVGESDGHFLLGDHCFQLCFVI